MIRILNKMVSTGTVDLAKDAKFLNEASDELKELVKNLEKDNHKIRDIKVSYFTNRQHTYKFTNEHFEYNQVWAQYVVLYD